eukprot:a845458_22.p1 GENE.a845458_22~~a845458_22.p1  ORF type:complete len:424 (+),score=139.41 a845458_22:44-1273(+)
MAALRPGQIGFLHVSVDDDACSVSEGSTPSPHDGASPSPSPNEGADTPSPHRRRDKDKEKDRKHKGKRKTPRAGKDSVFDLLSPVPEGESFAVISMSDLESIGDDIGHGAQGRVFVATYRGERVAVKTVDSELPSDEDASDFVNELAILSRLRDDNVLRCLGGSVRAPLILVTEFCARGSLFSFLHKTAEAYDPMRFALEIACGMSYLERHQIIHRDLKAENVLITEALSCKISDFGFAKQRSYASKAALQSIVGSPNYVAPEVARDGYYNNRCDVFSYGTLVWELFARRVPFSDRDYANSLMQQLLDICENGVRAGPIDADWPEHVQTLISLCWRTLPVERPSFAAIVSVLKSGPPPPVGAATPRPLPAEPRIRVSLAPTPPRPPGGSDSVASSPGPCAEVAVTIEHV